AGATSPGSTYWKPAHSVWVAPNRSGSPGLMKPRTRRSAERESGVSSAPRLTSGKSVRQRQRCGTHRLRGSLGRRFLVTVHSATRCCFSSSRWNSCASIPVSIGNLSAEVRHDVAGEQLDRAARPGLLHHAEVDLERRVDLAERLPDVGELSGDVVGIP